VLFIDCRRASALIVHLYLAAGALIAACGGSTRVSGSADTSATEAGVGPETSLVDSRAETDSETNVAALDGAACFIEASNYDQSCSVDSDCVASIPGIDVFDVRGLFIVFGNYCSATMCENCQGQGVINRSAVAQYAADVSGTPLGSGAIPSVPCFCALPPPVCCQNGLCVANNSCLGAIDAGPSDAGHGG
jgi:hypothetical protein